MSEITTRAHYYILFNFCDVCKHVKHQVEMPNKRFGVSLRRSFSNVSQTISSITIEIVRLEDFGRPNKHLRVHFRPSKIFVWGAFVISTQDRTPTSSCDRVMTPSADSRGRAGAPRSDIGWIKSSIFRTSGPHSSRQVGNVFKKEYIK